MSPWKDIASAPKDGTDVLLRRARRPPIVAASDPLNFNSEGWFTCDHPDEEVEGKLLGWMPLPLDFGEDAEATP